MALDPICGMTVDETTSIRANNDGQTWFFCCDACRRKFLGLPPAEARRTALPYFCPMCEGVESAKPGICPKCGMALESARPGEDDTTELDDMTRRFRVALALGIPVFMLAMAPMVIPGAWLGLSPAVSHGLQFILSTPVVAWCGWPLFQRAWHSLLSRNLNMFTLVGLGVGAAYGASLMALLVPGLFPASFRHHGEIHVYFEAASTIVALVLLGQVMELRARRRTGDAIRQLIKLAPQTAFVLRDGIELELPLEQVHLDELIRVRPGGKVPVDGLVVQGNGVIDTSLLTGESYPVDAPTGSEVAAGTINLTGSFLMRARRMGSDTLFARIIALVAEAQRSRAPIQNLADRVAAVFVPAVILIAVMTFIAWALWGAEPCLANALVNAVSVLIVACPCALGLATPMAVMVGVGRAAREGLLIRNAAVLEQLSRIDTLVVDKTGTLTEGRMVVSRIIPGSANMTEAQLLQLAASIEEPSEHPIGKAIVGCARSHGLDWLPVSRFESLTGMGVAGMVGGRYVSAGRISPQETTDAGGRHGSVPGIEIVVDGVVAGVILFNDQIRASAAGALKQLKHLGIRVIMLTGDREATARSVGVTLAIEEIHAGMTPEGKQARIKALRSEGCRVAMAGDGVNDAPALALADVGIAMGTGTDVAMGTAGVVLVKGDLAGLVKALRLGRAVMRNIRQNLFWAFIYNIAGVTLATGILFPHAGLLLNPMLAALAMSFSSVSVIANALRLRRVRLGGAGEIEEI